MTGSQVRRKVIGVPLEKTLTPQEDGSLLVLGKFTSDQRDEVGDIITRAATEKAVPSYKRWGNIRYMHQPKPVGRVTRIGVEDGLEWNEVEFKVIDPQAKFEVENGLLQALSVGILVNLDDVSLLEDGGWVINGYQLAEISLVDHPANYDAALELNLSMDEALRGKMREQGVIPVLRSMGAAPVEKGELMDENTNPVEPEANEEVEAQAQAPEQPEMDVEESAEAVTEQEAPVAEEEAEAVAEATQEEPEAEAEVAPEAEAVETRDPLAEALSQIALSLTALNSKVDGLFAHQEKDAPEADVESAPAETAEAAKGIGGEEDPRIAQLEQQVKDLTSQIAALTTPVDRKGALPEEEIPSEDADAESELPAEAAKPKSLSDAVGKYLQTRTRR